MTDHSDESAQLAAWLAGDLDDAEATALEQRLETEPALGARLDAVAATVAALRRYDAVELPSAASGRLRARLSAERGGDPHAPRNSSIPAAAAAHRTRVSPPPGGGAPPPGHAGTKRPAPERSQRERAARRGRLAGIAAAVLVVVVGIGGLLPLLNRGSVGDSADSAEFEVAAGEADAPDAPNDEALEMTSESAAEEAAAPEQAAQDRAADASAPAGPVVIDAGPPLGLSAEAATAGEAADDNAFAARFLGVPEAQALIGLPVEEARAVAAAFVTELGAAPDLFSLGVAPSACLDSVLTEDADVPVRVEGLTLDGSPALAHVVVRATPGAQVLDAVQVVITDPLTCAVIAAG